MSLKVDLDTKNFINSLNNLTQYSIGFLNGVEAAAPVIMDNLGKEIIETLKDFIDTNARVDPETLHHVYEWYQTGSPQARLFDIEYIVMGKNNLSFNYTFSQSSSFANNSNVPFYNKAEIMEKGTPVVIKPKSASVLSFSDNGEQIFTKKPILVSNPGGTGAEGGFEQTIKTFFDSYFTQAFLMTSGVLSHLNDPRAYKNHVLAGSKQGKSLGFKIGYEWATKGGRID
jgi:hypothetical protein